MKYHLRFDIENTAASTPCDRMVYQRYFDYAYLAPVDLLALPAAPHMYDEVELEVIGEV